MARADVATVDVLGRLELINKTGEELSPPHLALFGVARAVVTVVVLGELMSGVGDVSS